ncbi:hypothetical protein [Oceanirhabdus seepicola]|uniref:Uncharacterized protein n=1 Tax=Oceanirhabdus seepicola TaxID=2828781 RepID=A0A9J6P6Q2_9CLOT|nr:hypothetical protein [Oceanirhabdus seepicola]MCM1991485.1 hypothetical protein [Oceanirhabdus seepicola]
MKLRFKKNISKNKELVILDNKIDMPKDLYGDTHNTSLNNKCKMWM